MVPYMDYENSYMSPIFMVIFFATLRYDVCIYFLILNINKRYGLTLGVLLKDDKLFRRKKK